MSDERIAIEHITVAHVRATTHVERGKAANGPYAELLRAAAEYIEQTPHRVFDIKIVGLRAEIAMWEGPTMPPSPVSAEEL